MTTISKQQPENDDGKWWNETCVFTQYFTFVIFGVINKISYDVIGNGC
jgi:hypothetical protein